MADAPAFTKLVPGFDFLQGLVQDAGSALPHVGQWVAPTLNPEELEKRIEELRTVQFWLEQNARMLGATIQALEVQRMTLSTLKTMNVQMDDLRESLKIRVPGAPGAPAEERGTREGDKPAARGKAQPAASPATDGTAPVDPMQWWGALTRQFTQLAATAMKDSAADTAANFAGAMASQGEGTTGPSPKKGAARPAGKARKAAGPSVNKPARQAGRQTSTPSRRTKAV
jgi:hypothetical protein